MAEITSAFVCASLGIVPTVRHADYIGSWLEVMREEDRAIVRAASAASKAADYLLAFRPDAERPVEVPRTDDHLLTTTDRRCTPGEHRNADCCRGRPQSEGGRLRRDGSQATEGSAPSVTEIRRYANPTIRLYGITTTNRQRASHRWRPSLDRARWLHALTRAVPASAATTANRSRRAASPPARRSSTAG